MIDIKFIRNNPDLSKELLKKKNFSSCEIDSLLELDTIERKLKFDFDTYRAKQNAFSKKMIKNRKIPKKESKDLKKIKEIAQKIKDISSKLKNISSKIKKEIISIPNFPDSSVIIGKTNKDNIVQKEWGEKRNFSFEPKSYTELTKSMVSMERGSKISGSGFPLYMGFGAKLERALINFMLDYHTKNSGYLELSTPYIVSKKSMYGTGQLPKMEDDMYHITLDDMFLIPTSEVPLTNYFRDKIFTKSELPQKVTAFSPCFRREAGSYGKDTKGLQRVHQFNKVELVNICHPNRSTQQFETLLNDAQNIMQVLELPYRIVELCTGDLSFASAKTFDIEAFSPFGNKYYEVSSVSNFKDFQARRINIRLKEEGALKYVHTLNGSGLATPRVFITLIENYQNKKGKIDVPKVLRPYL